MKLNRERIAAGLGLLLLVFGAYRMMSSRIADSPPAISTEIPTFTDPVPRVEPRHYLENQGGDRNPFQLASDWAQMTPEPLDPPTVEPTRWFAMPLGKSPDPSLSGFTYPITPPQEIGGDEGPAESEKPPPRAPSAEPSPSGKAAPPGPAAPPAAAGAAAKDLKIQKKSLKSDTRRPHP